MEKNLSLELFLVLSRAYRSVMEHAIRDIRRYSLNPTEFAVLELLYHKGPHALQQIGEKILLASGSITYVVDKLEEKGYLTREPCEKDRRITYATITEKGNQLMDEIFPQHIQAITRAVAGLDEAEKAEALQLLKKLGISAKKALE
jgi:MarR family 2-MHQ and catechol resistance regulon transcriptional repressor